MRLVHLVAIATITLSGCVTNQSMTPAAVQNGEITEAIRAFENICLKTAPSFSGAIQAATSFGIIEITDAKSMKIGFNKDKNLRVEIMTEDYCAITTPSQRNNTLTNQFLQVVGQYSSTPLSNQVPTEADIKEETFIFHHDDREGKEGFLMLKKSRFLADRFNPFEGPKPIAVFIQTDPWAMLIGADTPRIAVYEDGTVLFLKRSGEKASYHQKSLSATELSAFKKRLKPAADLKDLKRFYNVHPNATDQPQALLYFRDGDRELTTKIYGLQAPDTKPYSFTMSHAKLKPDAVPGELIELHKFFCTVDYSDSREWTPRYVEAVAWSYSYAPDASIIWPKDWPGLDSERSFERRGSYSIFLDGSVLPDLQKFLQTRNEKGAIEIGGRKWIVSYRYTFPSEPVWMKAFQKKEEK
jgi:hypothetical protein